MRAAKYVSPERAYAKQSISASASAISGISGVGEKPFFERRREDGAGVGGAAGRSTEFGQRERRLQFEASRLLRLCDGDGGAEGLLGRRRIRGIALQEDVAAKPMEDRVRNALAGLLRDCQALVDQRQRDVRALCLRFQFSAQPEKIRNEEPVALRRM